MAECTLSTTTLEQHSGTIRGPKGETVNSRKHWCVCMRMCLSACEMVRRFGCSLVPKKKLTVHSSARRQRDSSAFWYVHASHWSGMSWNIMEFKEACSSATVQGSLNISEFTGTWQNFTQEQQWWKKISSGFSMCGKPRCTVVHLTAPKTLNTLKWLWKLSGLISCDLSAVYLIIFLALSSISLTFKLFLSSFNYFPPTSLILIEALSASWFDNVNFTHYRLEYSVLFMAWLLILQSLYTASVGLAGDVFTSPSLCLLSINIMYKSQSPVYQPLTNPLPAVLKPFPESSESCRIAVYNILVFKLRL